MTLQETLASIAKSGLPLQGNSNSTTSSPRRRQSKLSIAPPTN
jgi:hypothetical protein